MVGQQLVGAGHLVVAPGLVAALLNVPSCILFSAPIQPQLLITFYPRVAPSGLMMLLEPPEPVVLAGSVDAAVPAEQVPPELAAAELAVAVTVAVVAAGCWLASNNPEGYSEPEQELGHLQVVRRPE